MGLLKCPLPCHSHKNISEESSHHHSQSNHLHSESSTSSLSSQPSLPSVPSLAAPSHQPQQPPQPPSHHQLITTFKAHSSPIFSITLHGKFLYTGSSDSEIRAWSKDPFALQPSTNSPNNVVAISNGAVKSLIVSGDKLFSAHQDHKIRAWKIETQNPFPNQRYKCVATLPTFNDRFSKLFSGKNYVQVRRHKKSTWVHHVDTVSSLSLSSDGSLLYSASWDRSFKVWRTSDFKCLESVRNAHEDAINALVVSNDGLVYTGSADKKIKVWKKKQLGDKKHSLIATLEKHKSAVNALAVNIDGSVLYSGACDRSILVWEKETNDNSSNNNMVLVGAIRGHSKAILCLGVVEDLVCSGSADNTIRVWKRGLDKRYSCLAILEGHRKPVKCLSAAVDCNGVNEGVSDSGHSYLVYSGGLDYDVKVWQIWVPLV